MKGNFHETLAEGEAALPSERSTGLVFAAVALVVAILWRDDATVLWSSVALSLVMAAVSRLAPAALRPLNLAWFRFSLLVQRVMNPVVMFAVFTLVFVPAGLLMRLCRDPLRAKRPPGASYWIDRHDGKSGPGSMADQF